MIYVFLNDLEVVSVRTADDQEPPKELEGYHLAGMHEVKLQGGWLQIAVYNLDIHRVKALNG